MLDTEAGASLSALSGLTIQQILDLDVENLAVKIDKHNCQTKKAVLVRHMCSELSSPEQGLLPLTLNPQDHFMDTKTRLLSNQAQAVEEERRTGSSRLDAKQVPTRMRRITRTRRLQHLNPP